MNLFYDTNVVLDVLARRKPWADESGAALSLATLEGVEGFVAAHAITTLHYLLRKHLGAESAAAALVSLLGLVRAVPVGHETLLRALSLGWADVEDAVQAICALEVEADYLVTRDVRGMDRISLAVVSPAELLAIVGPS